MKTIGMWMLALMLGPWAMGQRIPGRYIVELTTEPVAEHVQRQPGRVRDRMASAAARTHRERIRGEQERMRTRLLDRGATVRDSADTVVNALFVEMSEEQAAAMAAEPGVKRVSQERTFHLLLDRALGLHHVPEAWERVGADRAGEGIKIAIIDTGVDVNHPGLAANGLSAPDGFPKVNYAFDAANVNGKVIVARSYVPLLRYRDPDNSVRDHVGHGTALSMIAAGGKADGPLATIQGVAPRAWIGCYKVFGTPGYNDSASDSAILKAMDDAVADGMDIINLSLGDDFAPRLADDVDVDAVERATAAGVLVVVAAGNNGPGMNTISSPATAPSALAVGSTTNARTFGTSVTAEGVGSFIGIAGGGAKPAAAVQGPLADVASLDGDGLGCGTLSGGSLSGKVALILRGACTFETKLLNAQRAGAVAGVVYAAADAPDPIGMSVGTATLPAQMVSNGDGLALKQAVGAAVKLDFDVRAVERPGGRVSDFSAVGPSVDLSVKPELMATGGDIYTATQSLDDWGDMYSATGYVLVDGTSFSTPLVAGAAALLKSARPGLTVADYRSLLVNSAAPVEKTWKSEDSTLQQTGAGLLDVTAALKSTVTANPVTLTWGAGATALDAWRKVTLTNRGAERESFRITVQPKRSDTAPLAVVGTVELEPGASAEVPLQWQAATMATGAQEGVVAVEGLTSGSVARVPYWYDATTNEPAAITLMYSLSSGRRGSGQQDAILVRVTDAAGVALTNVTPEVEVVSGGGSATYVTNYDTDIPGVFGISVYLGPVAGTNVFRVKAGTATLTVAIPGT